MSRGRLRAAIASILLAIVVSLFVSSSARADVTISVNPSFLEFAVDAGTSFNQLITVSNEGTNATGITVGVSASAPDRPDISSVDWVQIDPKEFKLGPAENQKVKISVSVPDNAPSGGSYSTILFSTSELRVKTDRTEGFCGASGLGAAIGAKLVLTVRGPDLRLEGELSKVVPLALGPGRIGFRAEIVNKGNVHLVPSGVINA